MGEGVVERAKLSVFVEISGEYMPLSSYLFSYLAGK